MRTPWVDSHCHIDFDVFDVDRAEVLDEAVSLGLEWLFIPGVEPPQWARLAALKALFPKAGVGVGVHPWFIQKLGAPNALGTLLEQACEELAPVAIGETGLDRVAAERGGAPLLDQTKIFLTHLQVAKHRGLPLVLHVVRAHETALSLLGQHGPFPAGGVVHSFSGSAEVAARYIALNFHVSFSGAVTRPSARRVQAAAQRVPMEWMLLETDAPDQPPVGFQGRVHGRSEPAALLAVASCVAQLRNTSLQSVLNFSRENALRLYRL